MPDNEYYPIGDLPVEQYTAEAMSPIVRLGGGRNTSKTAVQEKIRNKIRLHNTTFQARLGQKLDAIQRQVLDNNIRLSSHPTDMLRIKAERDPRSQDLISRTIEAAEVLPIYFLLLKIYLLGTLRRKVKI